MRVFHCFGHLLHESRREFWFKRSFFYPLPQTLPVNIRQRQKRLARMLADFVDLDNARMFELRCRFGFQLKTTNLLLTGEFPRPDQFYRGHAPQTDMPSLVDNAHTTPGPAHTKSFERKGR